MRSSCALAGAAAAASRPASSAGEPNCAPTAQVFLFPKTAHAAAELAAGGCYVSAVAAGTFTLTHANNAQTDRTFAYVCLG